MYTSGWKRQECSGNVSFYEDGGSFSINCGIRMHGDTSLIMPKKGMSLAFRGAYGQDELNYDLFGGGVTCFSDLLLRGGQNAKLKGDALIAMISVSALAFGYLLMHLFSTSSNLSGDVCSTLFGSTSILTLTKTEVWLCAVLSVIVVAVFILFYNKIFAVTFDESFARAAGTPVGTYNLLIAVTIAVIIVLAMNLVGSLLISALVIFPALRAMRVFKSFRSVTITSACIAVAASSLPSFAAEVYHSIA